MLADSVSFLYALSTGSLDHLELFEAIAGAEDAYGEVAAEFRTLLLETRYTDADYRTAIANRAAVTPSDDFSKFLTDLLSTIDSGGDIERFLADETERYSRTARRRQERILDSLDLVGELYLTVSLFPLFFLVIIVVGQLIPGSGVQTELLYLAVYGLTPLVGIAFLVLVSAVTPDEPGDGFLYQDREVGSPTGGWRRRQGPSHAESSFPDTEIFDRIRRRERMHRRKRLLARPHRFVLDRPLSTLVVTVPASVVLLAFAVALGFTPRSLSGLVAEPVRGTAVYVYTPLYLILVPLATVYEWNAWRRNAVTATLSTVLRNLSSANETGLTFLESLRTVSTLERGLLARELDVVTTKVAYGTSLRPALVQFANTYQTPRLARTVRLLGHAQEASNNLSAVLQTAAQTSERHETLERDRVARARTQIVIVSLTFLTALVVFAILQTQFLETMGELDLTPNSTGADPDSPLDVDRLSLLFFHTLTVQAFVSGLICGYLRDGCLASGLKYVLCLATVALLTWSVIA
ncbi:type II secretion system F family protein [Halobacteria archaeon AArc-dxtr1]|nr:type II secretion system F family protein [Halobacteria archaeon AArc-dxtr1]